MTSDPTRFGRGLAKSWAAVATAFLSGCGGGYEVATAHGKVVCEGVPVAGGTVTFAPAGAEGEANPGKAATATVQPNGTFVLTTYSSQDGAVVGTHRVTYTRPEDFNEEESEVEEGSPEEARLMAEQAAERKKRRRQPKPNVCRLDKPLSVEVKPGEDNDFTIELTPKPPRRQREL